MPNSTLQISFRLVAILLGVLLSLQLSAQASIDFESSTSGTNAYVDANDASVLHDLVNNPLPQTPVNADPIGSQLGYLATFTPSRTGSSNSGLNDGDLFGVVDITIPASADNSMGSLSIDYTAAPPPAGGNKLYTLEDPDGLMTLRFSPMNLTGTAAPAFSMNYIINNTSYENSNGGDDRIKIYLDVDNGSSEIVLLEAMNDGIPDLETWQTLNQDLTAQIGSTVQLVIEIDMDSGSEEMAIDNISFSEGTIVTMTGCIAADAPMLSQAPASICEGLGYRINIAGNLNGATDWVFYTDAAASQQAGMTSANVITFNDAQAGTSYYVRSEGGCTEPGTLVQYDLMITDPGSCMPDATPGTSFEEPLGFTTSYVDTGDPTMAHQLMNNPGQPTVQFPVTATEMGFDIFFTPTRTDGTGLTDGDDFGVSNNDAELAFPDGSQGLSLEDTDGRIRVEFTPVDMTGVANPILNFRAFLNGTSYEAGNGSVDSMRVFIDVDDGSSEIEIISGQGVGGNGLNNFSFVNSWVSVTSLSGIIPSDAIVQLIIEVDFDAGTEFMLFDDISFTGGTLVIPNDCATDMEMPVVSCPEDLMVPTDFGFCDAEVPTLPQASVMDNCTENIDLVNTGTLNFYPLGSTEITVSGTDAAGNAGNCTYNIIVFDNQVPIITANCPAEPIMVEGDADTCSYTITGNEFVPVFNDCLELTVTNDLNGQPNLAGAFLPLGENIVTFTATDTAGLSTDCVLTIVVTDTDNSCISSLSEAELAHLDLQLFPNPTNGISTIEFRATDIMAELVELRDLNGRLIEAYSLSPTADGWYRQQVNVENLAAGLYLLQVVSDRGVFSRKLLVR